MAEVELTVTGLKLIVDSAVLPPTEPPVEPPDPGEPEPIKPEIIKNQNGFVLENKIWTGNRDTDRGFKFVGCNDVVVKDCFGTGSGFSGLWFDDCQNFLIEGGEYWENGRVKSNGKAVGHGIHISGNSTGTVRKTKCFKNLEDGAQHAESMTGTVVYEDVEFFDNFENAFDTKGGRAKFKGGTLHSAAKKHEALLVQINTRGVELEGTELVSESFKAFINLVSGTADLNDCLFRTMPHRDDKYFLVGNKLYHADSLPDFRAGSLTVVNGQVV